MRYRIEFTKAAERELRDLPANVLKRVDARTLSLAETPRPDGVRKLVGIGDFYRIRIGEYRVIYEIRDAAVIVIAIRARHRREAYR